MYFDWLFNNVTDIVVLLDSKFKIQRVSPSVESILGYKPNELIGLPIRNLEISSPNERQITLQDVKRILKSDNPPMFDIQLLAKDGTRKYCLVHSARLKEIGNDKTWLLKFCR